MAACLSVLVVTGEENGPSLLRLGQPVGVAFGRGIATERPAVVAVIPYGLSDEETKAEVRSFEVFRKTLVAEGLGLEIVRAAIRFTAIVDAGILRYKDQPKTAAEQREHLALRAIAWNRGRQAFSVHCGHCHGDDGSETSYPNVKSLARITEKISDEKILTGARDFGAIDVTQWSRREQDELLLFIRGL